MGEALHRNWVSFESLDTKPTRTKTTELQGEDGAELGQGLQVVTEFPCVRPLFRSHGVQLSHGYDDARSFGIFLRTKQTLIVRQTTTDASAYSSPTPVYYNPNRLCSSILEHMFMFLLLTFLSQLLIRLPFTAVLDTEMILWCTHHTG